MSMMPEGEDLRKATKWISNMRKEDPDASVDALIDEASTRYNLSPKDTEFLVRFLSGLEADD